MADTRYEDGILFYSHDLVQVGPLNMICSEVISAVKRKARMISSYNVPVNWWTDFSSWQDFRGLLRSGIKLAIHEVVENLNRNLVTPEDFEAYVENIDENGNIEIEITENNSYILQSFTVKASRKKLKRLKEVAPYNVGHCLCLPFVFFYVEFSGLVTSSEDILTICSGKCLSSNFLKYL